MKMDQLDMAATIVMLDAYREQVAFSQAAKEFAEKERQKHAILEEIWVGVGRLADLAPYTWEKDIGRLLRRAKKIVAQFRAEHPV
jgi:hypothetical protein